MSAIETINPTPVIDSKQQNGVNSPEHKKKGHNQQPDALLLAYMYIFQSVQIDHNTAQIQAKKVETNAVAQGKLIQQEAGINFYQLQQSQLFSKYNVVSSGGGGGVHYKPKKVSQTVLENLESKNQEVSAVRNVMEDKLTVLRQSAQIGETNLNTVMDSDQQSVQQGASLMQMLMSLTNQVTKI